MPGTDARRRNSGAPAWRGDLLRHYPALGDLPAELTALLHARGRLSLVDPGILAEAARELGTSDPTAEGRLR
jgi:hypothetical protein